VITKKVLMDAPYFTAFFGPAERGRCTKRRYWDVFAIDGGRVFDDHVGQRAEAMGIHVRGDDDGMLFEPEVNDELRDESCADDLDACLAYLAKGGALVKLPDEIGSRYYRFYVLRDDDRHRSMKHEKNHLRKALRHRDR